MTAGTEGTPPAGAGQGTGQPQGTPPAGDQAGLEKRVDGLEQKLDTILEFLQGKEGKAQGDAEKSRAAELNAPTSIADEVRSQLDQARAAEQDKANRDSAAQELAAVKNELKELKEAMPGGPQRRIERMWA